MATSTYTDTATQAYLFTAFSEVQENPVMRRCCLIQRMNNSMCLRARYELAMVSARSRKWLVRKASRKSF